LEDAHEKLDVLIDKAKKEVFYSIYLIFEYISLTYRIACAVTNWKLEITNGLNFFFHCQI